jgi:transposase
MTSIGCHIEYLPPYSPDYNPIERSFSCLKAFIRKQKDFVFSLNPVGDLVWAAQQCITQDKAIAWIRSCGYTL